MRSKDTLINELMITCYQEAPADKNEEIKSKLAANSNHNLSGKICNSYEGDHRNNRDRNAEEELKECYGELLQFNNQAGGTRRENSIIGMSSGDDEEVYRPYEEADSFYRQRVTTTEACEIFNDMGGAANFGANEEDNPFGEKVVSEFNDDVENQ